jgi:hypothetical protein
VIDFKKHMQDTDATRAGRRCHRVPPRACDPAPTGNALTGSEFGRCEVSTAKPITEWSLLEQHPDRYARLLTDVQIDELLSTYTAPNRRRFLGWGNEPVLNRLMGKVSGKSWDRQTRPALVERTTRAGNWYIKVTSLGERVAAEFLCLVPTTSLADARKEG